MLLFCSLFTYNERITLSDNRLAGHSELLALQQAIERIMLLAVSAIMMLSLYRRLTDSASFQRSSARSFHFVEGTPRSTQKCYRAGERIRVMF